MKSFFILLVSLVSAGAADLSIVPNQGQLSFVPNQGQAPSSVRFLSRNGAVAAQFADNAMSLKAQNAAVRVEFAGASLPTAARLTGDTVSYREAWPGIEVQYGAYQRTVKSEYHVGAGADPNLIR